MLMRLFLFTTSRPFRLHKLKQILFKERIVLILIIRTLEFFLYDVFPWYILDLHSSSHLFRLITSWRMDPQTLKQLIFIDYYMAIDYRYPLIILELFDLVNVQFYLIHSLTNHFFSISFNLDQLSYDLLFLPGIISIGYIILLVLVVDHFSQSLAFAA